MSGKILRVLKGLYKNANVCIRKESGCVTEEFKTERGLRQGCQLSPILFTLYINGIIECLEKIETQSPSLKGGKEVKVLLYADDLVLLSLTKIGLQRAFHELEKFCDLWSLKVNVGKTKILSFGKGIGKKYDWFYKGERVEEVNSFRYLGVILQNNLNWKKQQEEVIRRAERGWRLIRGIIYQMECDLG